MDVVHKDLLIANINGVYNYRNMDKFIPRLQVGGADPL